MSIQKVVEIYNRDMRAICVFDKSYKLQIINNAILFYSKEMELPDGHQSKIFSDYEYRMLINLYQEERKHLLS